MITTDNTETLKNALAEIERLNTQVAMLITASQSVIARWDTPLWKDAPATGIFINELRRYTNNPVALEWLSAYGAKVRDDALENAAAVFDKTPVQYWHTAATLRAMKRSTK